MQQEVAPVFSADPEPPAIELSDMSFAWDSRGEGFRLEIPAWRVERGARLALLGRSGTGKTTLLNLLAGVSRAQRGAVRVLGQDLSQLSAARRDRFRGDHIGLVFQMFNLLPFANVLENVLLPLRFSPFRRARLAGPPADEARRLLARLGLTLSNIENRAVSALSVGQQQRVAAARALIGAPELIIADEPTSALDRESRDLFLNLLFEETARSGATLLTVTHDEAVAERFASRADLDRLQTMAPGDRATAGEPA